MRTDSALPNKRAPLTHLLSVRWQPQLGILSVSFRVPWSRNLSRLKERVVAVMDSNGFYLLLVALFWTIIVLAIRSIVVDTLKMF